MAAPSYRRTRLARACLVYNLHTESNGSSRPSSRRHVYPNVSSRIFHTLKWKRTDRSENVDRSLPNPTRKSPYRWDLVPWRTVAKASHNQRITVSDP